MRVFTHRKGDLWNLAAVCIPPRRVQHQLTKKTNAPHAHCSLCVRMRVMRVMIDCPMLIFLEKLSAFPFSACYHSRVESTVQLKTPRGITVEEAAQLLRYSTSTVRRLIAAHILVAWKPGGPAGRKYLIDEISLARWQAESIRRAREEASTTQTALLRGELPLVW